MSSLSKEKHKETIEAPPPPPQPRMLESKSCHRSPMGNVCACRSLNETQLGRGGGVCGKTESICL